MGGFSQFLDFNPGNRARKQKKRRGSDTPRNSLELPAEAFQSYYAVKDHASYAYDGTQDLSTRESYSSDATMKNLVHEEMTNRTNRKQNGPNIVARLMGMDVVLSDTRSVTQPLETNEKIGTYDIEEGHTEKDTAVLKDSSKSSVKGLHRYPEYGEVYSDKRNKGANMNVSWPRVHPQEKELQQFKKEFEAWQAARFLELARVVELGNIPEDWLAQLNLTKEKMALYENLRKAAIENMDYLQNNISNPRSQSSGESRYHGYKKEQIYRHRRPPIAEGSFRDQEMYSALPFQDKEVKGRGHYVSRNLSRNSHFKHHSMTESDRKPGKYHAPARIVILKPGSDSFSSIDESWVSSSGSMEDRDRIDDILEEVNERLKHDVPGKTGRNGRTVRGAGIETPFKEKSSRSKLTTHCVPEHAVENLDRELGTDLVSLGSTRLDVNEVEDYEPGSPEFISKDTREFLLDRLRNALYREKVQETPNVSRSSPMEPVFDNVRERLEEARDILSAENGRSYWKDMNYQTETQTRSFRHQLPDERNTEEELSPRNLVRCFSSPVSGTSLAKLLLEDRHVVSGAHIRRKLESLEDVTVDGKNRKKDGFTFLEKVSSIKYNLKEKLFTRKIQPNHLSQSDRFNLVNDRANEQGALTDYRDTHDNFTEVPPSPASVYTSSAYEEYWKAADHPSPLSKSDVSSIGDQSVRHIFRDISFNLTELRRQLNQLDHDGSEITIVTEEPLEADLVELEDEAQSYVRDLMIASGLYHGALGKSFIGWDDPLTKLISTRIFEQVEASNEENGEHSVDQNDKSLQHRLLFDLLNEVLSTICRPYMISSSFTTKVTISTFIPPPNGRVLFDKAWNIIRGHLYHLTDKSFYSVEDIVAHDLCSASWSSNLDEDVDVVMVEFERQLISKLVEEIVEDLL